MIEQDTVDALVTALLDRAEQREQVEVVAGASSTVAVRAYDGAVENLTVADTAGLGVRVIRDGQLGFASAGTLDRDVAIETLEDARDNLRFAASDPHVALAVDDGHRPEPQSDLWSDGVELMPIASKVELAIELERRTRAIDERVFGVRNATYSDRRSLSVLASSTGLRADSRSTMCSVGVSALSTDGTQTQTGAANEAFRDPHDLDVERVAADAVERATRLLGATKPASGHVTLVVEPQLASSVLSILGSMLSGERVLKGRTPFGDRVGEIIAAVDFTMVDDPTDPASFGARVFDGEGLAARRNPLVSKGRLDGFLYDSITASRAGAESTASAVRGIRSTPSVGWHALHVAPGVGDLASLIADVELGLLVQTMSGLHSGVNAVSGDFSVGVDGLMIRNGELAEPIREATVASTLPRMLNEIVGIGADVDHRSSGISAPSLSFGGISLSGT